MNISKADFFQNRDWRLTFQKVLFSSYLEITRYNSLLTYYAILGTFSRALLAVSGDQIFEKLFKN